MLLLEAKTSNFHWQQSNFRSLDLHKSYTPYLLQTVLIFFFKKLVQIYCHTHRITERKTRLQKSLQKCESKLQDWVQNHSCKLESWNALSGSSPSLVLKIPYLSCNNLVCHYSNYACFYILIYLNTAGFKLELCYS